MGRNYAEELPSWAWNPRMRSKVRGWVTFNYSSPWEAKRALIEWARGMRARGHNIWVTEREINIARGVIEMRNRLIVQGFL